MVGILTSSLCMARGSMSQHQAKTVAILWKPILLLWKIKLEHKGDINRKSISFRHVPIEALANLRRYIRQCERIFHVLLRSFVIAGRRLDVAVNTAGQAAWEGTLKKCVWQEMCRPLEGMVRR